MITRLRPNLLYRAFVLFACIAFGQLAIANSLTCKSIFSRIPVDNKQAPQLMKNTVAENEFTTNRPLGDYMLVFKKIFIERVETGASWLDLGSGSSRALISAVEGSEESPALNKNLKAVGISYVIPSEVLNRKVVQPKQSVWSKLSGKKAPVANKVKLISGQFFEDIPYKEIGRMELITDLFGVMSYAPHVDRVFKKAMNVLKTKGDMFIYFGDNYGGQVRTSHGTVSVMEWISSIPGLEVEIINERMGSMRIRKISDKINVPQLELISSDTGQPPIRVYQTVKPLQ